MSIGRHAGDPPSPFEVRYGFSRVVTAGPFVMVNGTTSMDELGFVIGLSMYEQAAEVLRKVVGELSRAGAAATDVVSCHAYLTDISRADDVGRAFGEVFSEVRPLLTMVEVSGLIDPRMQVEIEATAYLVTDGDGSREPGGSAGT